MIIKGNNHVSYIRTKRVLLFLGIICLVTLGLIFLPGLFRNDPPALYACDAETVSFADPDYFFEGVGAQFKHGHTQSDRYARSGNNSSMVEKENSYGMLYETSDVKGGDIINVSVWSYTKTNMGTLVIDGNWGLYQTKKAVMETGINGWAEIRTTVHIPFFTKDATVKIYVFNNQEVPAYFDDLSIRVFREGRQVILPDYSTDSIAKLNFIISELGIKKLDKIRRKAIENGVLKTSEDDWVKAKLITAESEMSCKLRLKGDWPDHLLGEKWSLRIKMKAPGSWNRMMTFSVQNPNTRHFLDEWIFHQMLMREGVLSPRYGFIALERNGESKGIFAYEEHFEKQLPEYNKRREGPIVKFSESGFWMAQELQEKTKINMHPRWALKESSTIEPFRESRTIKDSTLLKQFQIAQNLMEAYKNGERGVDEIFDLDILAKYIAVIDVCQAFHGFIWHNQRFYYNPMTSRLEPIGFDGYTTTGAYLWLGKPFVGYAMNARMLEPYYRELMWERFFLNEDFLEKYIANLVRISSTDYLTEFLVQKESELNSYEKLIQKEFTHYAYNRNFLVDNARDLRKSLFPFPESSLKVYKEGARGGKNYFKVYNFHCLPVKVIGVGANSDLMDAPVSDKVLLPAYSNRMPPEYEEVSSVKKAKYMFFTIPGIDSIFQTKIIPWRAPGLHTPEQELFENVELDSGELYELRGTEIHIKDGAHTLSHNFLIPEGYLVTASAGTTLDFVQGAKFISKSPVIFMGTKEEPIKITSSDKSAGGFTVLQAWDESILEYVIFNNLNTLDYKGWTLTGAVTFYESQVRFNECTFSNNLCEDALNLVRSNFKLKNSIILNAPFDGFDADFCTGWITNCRIQNTGNDGLDFSGSNITVTGCVAKEIGDKGISVGEQSNVNIVAMTINGAKMGAVAKDLSQLNIDMITLIDVNQGFAAYRKKAEYGGAKIIIKDYNAENVKILHSIESGSTLILKEEEIKGQL